jgi:hypothetical protein
MRLLFATAVAVTLTAAVVAAPAPADAPAPLVGVWAKDAGGVELRFDFRADGTAKIVVTAGDNGIDATAKYTAGKDGKVEMTVTESKEVGTFPGVPPKGTKYTFTFKPDGKTAKLSGFGGGEDAERAKEAVEGDYTKIEPKKEK